MDKRCLTETETSMYISMSRSYLRQDRMNGFRRGRKPGPPFVKISNSVRYLKDDLDAWLEQYRVNRAGDVNNPNV